MVLERLTKEDGIDMNVLMAIWFRTVLKVLDPFFLQVPKTVTYLPVPPVAGCATCITCTCL